MLNVPRFGPCDWNTGGATPTVNENWPLAVGVPVMTPPGDSVRPGGRYVNGASVHVSVPVPPLAVNVFVYAVATFPAVSVKFPLIEIVVTFSVNCRAPKLAALLESA